MADYIHKNILSEAYVHIEKVHLNENDKEKFKQQLLIFTESRGRFAIYDTIEPEVRTQDGSLKVYSTITGTLSAALGDYPTFDEALDNLYIDAKRLAEAMILETLFIVKARGKSIARREARTGIVRLAKELFDHILQMNLEAEDDSPRIAIRRVVDVRTKIEKLLAILASEDDVALIKIQAKEKISKLITPKRLEAGGKNIVIYRAERKRLAAVLA